MKMFICEFITGGGMQQKPLPPDLVHEGTMMLQALRHDAVDAGITDIVTTMDHRLAEDSEGCRVLSQQENAWEAWCHIMHGADVVWPVAPETGNALLTLSELALECGCKLYGCNPESVELTGSKFNTFRYLQENRIPVIESCRPGEDIPDSGDGWVLKPDDGVGGNDCRFFPERKGLEEAIRMLPDAHGYVVQPFIKGIPASLSMLCYRQSGMLLACNQQQFVFHDAKGYLEGIIVNGLAEHWSELEPLACRIAEILPGLAGYVGIDLVMGESGPQIVEINPRLTTAYAGLRQSMGMNPVAMVVELFETGRMPSVKLNTRNPVAICLQ